MTFSVVAGVGLAVLLGMTSVLSWLGSPTWLIITPWLVPTAGALAWGLIRPTPAIATDDDDDSWIGFALRYVMIGEDEPRSIPLRMAAAVLLGAPVAWALGVFGVLSILGIM